MRIADHLEVMGADVDRYARDAQERDRLRLVERGRELDRQPLDRRVALVQAVAKAGYVDINSELRLIRHMLKGGRQNHATQRVEKLEARLRLRTS